MLLAENVLAVSKLCKIQKDNKKSNHQVSDETTEEVIENIGGISDLVEKLLTVDTEEERAAILVPMLKVLSKELKEINEPDELFAYWKLSRQWCQELLEVFSATSCVVNGLLELVMKDCFSGTAKNLYTTAFFLIQCYVSVITFVVQI